MSSKPTIFQSYFGSKNASGVLHQIINEIRPHDVYLELFAGGGIVARSKRPATVNVVNDVSETVYWDWLKLNLPTLLVTNANALDLLRGPFSPNRRYCIYLDPPYPLGSRRSPRPVYDYEMTDEQHIELLRTVKNLSGHIDVLISTYQNPIYERELKDWRRKSFPSMTRAGKATELLYMNYDNPTGVLHQYDYLGTDFTDRQRIKRKIDRKVSQLIQLDAKERQAILSALASIDENNSPPGKSEASMVATSAGIEIPVYGRPELKLAM